MAETYEIEVGCNLRMSDLIKITQPCTLIYGAIAPLFRFQCFTPHFLTSISCIPLPALPRCSATPSPVAVTLPPLSLAASALVFSPRPRLMLSAVFEILSPLNSASPLYSPFPPLPSKYDSIPYPPFSPFAAREARPFSHLASPSVSAFVLAAHIDPLAAACTLG